jgi:hypothetical protein
MDCFCDGFYKLINFWKFSDILNYFELSAALINREVTVESALKGLARMLDATNINKEQEGGQRGGVK